MLNNPAAASEKRKRGKSTDRRVCERRQNVTAVDFRCKDGRGHRTGADLHLVDGTKVTERLIARGGLGGVSASMLPTFQALRSTIIAFDLIQSQICNVTTELGDEYGLPRITPEQLCKYLSGKRDIQAQALESIEIAVYILSKSAFSYYRSLCDYDRELIASEFSCQAKKAKNKIEMVAW